jgi:2-methylcitrate dehydratase PrpD
MTTHAAQVLGKFAADLKFSDIPQDIVTRAKDCITDTVGAATFGSQFPWSRMAAEYAQRYGSGGPCSVIGSSNLRVQAPFAALANGVCSHAFEQDAVREPGVGCHAGATLMPVLLAISEENGLGGEAAVTAFVAGVEVMFRIGLASHHSPEKIGFHAPGLTGPYGAAIAVGKLLKFNAEQMSNALGIAGSLSSGLLAFSKSKTGGMVKRLHLGRSAEAGILAARLAGSGYTGPETILEGKFGFLDAYGIEKECEPELLTHELGKHWETKYLCLKRYACHVNAQASVQATRTLMDQHGFKGADVETLLIEGHERLPSHHNILEPGDVMQAQYSVPFCVALALFRDPEDPKNFGESAVQDPQIRAMCRKIQMRAIPEQKSVRTVKITVGLKDKRQVSGEYTSFKGMPADPLTGADLKRKFLLLTADLGKERSAALYDKLSWLESLDKFSLA